ncbi:MAG: GerMN domain-containing protein [Firmicutes bacterium]|nr:GerMN domain-containing protein [Bacillota bacterium]
MFSNRKVKRLIILGVVLAGVLTAVYFTLGREAAFFGPRQTQTVNLYFARPDANYLVAEKREISYPQVVPEKAALANGAEGSREAVLMGKAIVRELIAGPRRGSPLVATIPPGVALRGLTIRDGVAVADFNLNLKKRHPGGSAGEMATVYSIVTSLTQLPGVKRVSILVEGKRMETLVGHLDLSQPLEPDWNFIQR